MAAPLTSLSMLATDEIDELSHLVFLRRPLLHLGLSDSPPFYGASLINLRGHSLAPTVGLGRGGESGRRRDMRGSFGLEVPVPILACLFGDAAMSAVADAVVRRPSALPPKAIYM